MDSILASRILASQEACVCVCVCLCVCVCVCVINHLYEQAEKAEMEINKRMVMKIQYDEETRRVKEEAEARLMVCHLHS